MTPPRKPSGSTRNTQIIVAVSTAERDAISSLSEGSTTSEFVRDSMKVIFELRQQDLSGDSLIKWLEEKLSNRDTPKSESSAIIESTRLAKECQRVIATMRGSLDQLQDASNKVLKRGSKRD